MKQRRLEAAMPATWKVALPHFPAVSRRVARPPPGTASLQTSRHSSTTRSGGLSCGEGLGGKPWTTGTKSARNALSFKRSAVDHVRQPLIGEAGVINVMPGNDE